MSEAQKILKLIEGVYPADAGTLNEIDARVWCYRKGRRFLGVTKNGYWEYSDDHDAAPVHAQMLGTIIPSMGRHSFFVTKSRDALKSIRPEGWVFGMVQVKSDGLTDYTAHYVSDRPRGEHIIKRGKPLPTEELAELHAIIQSIEWTRNNESK